MVEGIIFDVDGTILDSMGIWDDAGEIYLNSLGIEPENNLGKILFSMSMREGAEYLKKTYGLKSNISEIVDGINNTIFQFYENDVLLKNGMLEFLQYMKDRAVPMTVATTSDRIVIEAAFQRLKIEKYFMKIFTSSEIGKGKNEPDIYFAAADFMGTNIENTWVAEDAIHAIKTAKNAGFKTIGIYDDSSREVQEEIKKVSDLYIESWLQVNFPRE